MGIFQTPNDRAIMGNAPPQNRGTASGALATMRNTGSFAFYDTFLIAAIVALIVMVASCLKRKEKVKTDIITSV